MRWRIQGKIESMSEVGHHPDAGVAKIMVYRSKTVDNEKFVVHI